MAGTLEAAPSKWLTFPLIDWNHRADGPSRVRCGCSAGCPLATLRFLGAAT
jgi:hypothetical protein